MAVVVTNDNVGVTDGAARNGISMASERIIDGGVVSARVKWYRGAAAHYTIEK